MHFLAKSMDNVAKLGQEGDGGSGYMRGTVVERLYRDNRILSIGGGTHEIMNEVIAKQLGL